MVCFKQVKAMRGIFCANSHFSRGEWTPCGSIWHAECYTCLGQDKVKFPTAEVKDTEGNTWHQEEGRMKRLNQGVEGAHLCTSFQCELCWFRNLIGKDPLPGVHDMAIRCLCRCNLDIFAGRLPSTIRGNKLEILTLQKNFESIGMPMLLQSLGPLPVGDLVEMEIALGMQLKSITAKGRIVDSVKFATVRGVRGTATLNRQASPLGMGEASSFSRGKGRVRPAPDLVSHTVGLVLLLLTWYGVANGFSVSAGSGREGGSNCASAPPYQVRRL